MRVFISREIEIMAAVVVEIFERAGAPR